MAKITTRRGFPLDVRPYLTTIFTWNTDGDVKIPIDEIWQGQGYGSPIGGGIGVGADGNELTLDASAPFIPNEWLYPVSGSASGHAPLQSFASGTASWASPGAMGDATETYQPFFFNQEESTNIQLRLFSQNEWQSDGIPSSAMEFRLYTDLIQE
tara:strand:- start:20532 stop:20996 length:465 start_codon:yes stop_codon:yes gene_type:complete